MQPLGLVSEGRRVVLVRKAVGEIVVPPLGLLICDMGVAIPSSQSCREDERVYV